jgi:hypothetical protein
MNWWWPHSGRRINPSSGLMESNNGGQANALTKLADYNTIERLLEILSSAHSDTEDNYMLTLQYLWRSGTVSTSWGSYNKGDTVYAWPKREFQIRHRLISLHELLFHHVYPKCNRGMCVILSFYLRFFQYILLLWSNKYLSCTQYLFYLSKQIALTG